MLNPNDTLYFHSIAYDGYHNRYWNSVKQQCGEGGQFFIDIARKFTPSRLVSRNGDWSLPWQQEIIPEFEMPAYDPSFSKTYEQVTDERAQWVRQEIAQGKKFAIMYSGGIDSTLIMAALIKNLTDEEKTSILVCASLHSIAENPTFWKKFIQDKFKVIDSGNLKYDYLIEQGYIPITGDTGDTIFGTVMGLGIYANYDFYISELSPESKSHLESIKTEISNPDVHFSNYKDIILRHFKLDGSPDFPELFYRKLVKNINTSTVPVNSLHDFFWWEIFNTKYLNCAVRGALYFNDRVDCKTAIYTIIDWFHNDDYQRWSMVNNNGQKIVNAINNYKMAARNYIWNVDRNDWYKHFKLKFLSLSSIAGTQPVDHLDPTRYPAKRVGVTKDFEMLYLDDPGVKEFFLTNLQNYKIDW